MAVKVIRKFRLLFDVVWGTPNDGDVPIYVSAADKLVMGPQAAGPGGGAPTGADYLVGTAQPGLSAEIVVGVTPGGELGGTWASPTVDAVHSGSSHAQVQAAAEATASAYTDAAIAGLVDTAPGTLDTLNELAAALGDDPNFASTVTTALAGKQPLDSDLTAIAALAPSDDDIIQRKSGAWTNRTLSQLKADLGLTTGKLFLSAAGMWPSTTNGAAANTKVESATNKQNVYVLDFADGATKLYAEATVAMPADWDGGTVTAVFYWLTNGTSTNSVVWGCAGRSYGDAETLDQAWGTEQTVTDAGTSTANQVLISAASSAITLGGTPAASELVQFRVSRDPTNGSDTLAQTARLLGVMITYTKA